MSVESGTVCVWPGGMVAVSAATLLDQVAEQIRERIVSGTLRRGQTLRRRRLARELGAPEMVLSRALPRLEIEGYLVRSGHGFAVAPLLLDAHRLLIRRLRLERTLTRQGAARITPFGLRVLEQLHRDLLVAQRRGDVPVVQRCNYRFHFTLYGYAGRPDLLGEVRAIWAVFPFDLMTTMPHRMAAVADEHAAVLCALRRGDPSRAARAMAEHVGQGWQEFKRSAAVLKKQGLNTRTGRSGRRCWRLGRTRRPSPASGPS